MKALLRKLATVVVVCMLVVPGEARQGKVKKEHEIKVQLPKIERSEVKEERDWQRSGRVPVPVDTDWNGDTMQQEDLRREAMPLLMAGTDLCPHNMRRFMVRQEPREFAPGCDFVPLLREDWRPSAYTDGNSVWFTRGMLRHLKSADEFRVVLGHEIGHILAGHVRRKINRRAWAQIGGVLLGGIASKDLPEWEARRNMRNLASVGDMMAIGFSKKFELEADYIGGYLTVLSGGDLDTASMMWRRWGKGQRGSFFRSHPTESKRFVVLRKTSNEIGRKVASGERLVPNVRKRTNR